MGSGGSTKNHNPNKSVNEFVDIVYACQPFEYSLYSTEEDEAQPFPRSGHKIVCDEGNLYTYGGYNPNNPAANNEDMSDQLFQEVWKYNFAHMKWKKLPIKGIPCASASVSVILSGKLMIVYGGTGMPFHLKRSNKLHICNLEDPEPNFKLIETTGKLPIALYGQAIFMKGNYLYTMGGTTGFDYYIDIHRLNLHTKEWEEVYINKGFRDDPPGRYRHELAVVGDKVYLIGGGTGSDAFDLDEIPVFDLKSKSWTNLITVCDSNHRYPPPRQYHSVVQIPGKNSFIMVGGMSDTGAVLDDAWKLDIPSMKWKKICSLQLTIPVYFHASCVTESGKMYVFGGVTKNDETMKRVADVQSSWICIPKLKDICWEAVTEYGFIDNEEYIDHKLLPLEYTKRLTV